MEIQSIEEVITEAKEYFQSKDYANAINGFEVAHTHFLEKGDELNAAEMANNLSVAFLQLGKKVQALEIVQGTDQIFEKHNDPIRQAMALGNLAAALEATKKFEEAELAYQQSADLFEQHGEKEYHTHVMKSLAALQIRRGKQLDSLISMQKSLTGKKNPSLKDRLLSFLLKIPFRIADK